jgi:ABC-type bacteriocin/lantibiotic exporter with double-glycine peptidase domain
MVPDLRQSSSYDCGDTAIRIIATHHGWGLPRQMVSNPIDGTDPRTLESVFRADGRFVVSGEFSLTDLIHYTKAGWPVITLIQLNGVGHYVVVWKILQDSIRFQCPSRGPCRVSHRGFLGSWKDVDRYGTHYRFWGLVAWGEVN